jgi:peroxiredoxin
MMNARRLVFALAALLLVAAPGVGAGPFKPFKLRDLNGTSKTLQDYQNKATLISFFFPSCSYCNAEFPAVQKIFDKYKDQGLSAVWINLVPSENSKIPEWQTKHGFTVPVLVGASQASLQRDYKVKMSPTHYLLDENGNVVFSHAGYRPGDEKKLEEQIRCLLKLAP